MVELNAYTISYVRYNEEKTVDVIAPTPERAIEDARRWLVANYMSSAKIVEMVQIVEGGIYYKTPKRKQR